MRYKIAAASVLLLIVGFLLGWSFQPLPADGPAPAPSAAPPAGGAAEQPQTVSVMLDFGDGEVRTFQDVDLAGAKTVFDVMKSLSESGNGFALGYAPPGQYGVMVEQIGNKKGGDDGGKYWLFWVNNVMADRSADNTPVRAGDVIEWKFVNLKIEGGEQP